MLVANNLSYKSQLHSVHLAIEPGKVHGLLGSNGAGKTTLFKLISGIWHSNSGEVLWKGKPIHTQDRRSISRLISIVLQTHISFPYRVKEVVEMGLYPHSGIDRTNKVDQTLELVDATHLKNRLMTQLSQGEQQRVLIARSLVTDTPIILLDEPTSHLDISHQIQIWELMQKLAKSGKLIFISSHNLSQCARYCDQITLMKKGRVVAHGNFHDLLYKGDLDRAFNTNISKLHIMENTAG